MSDISELDSFYEKYISNIDKLLPDSIVVVDLNLLQTLGLLNFHQLGQYNPGITRYFQLIESPNKITLINDQFFIWIASRQLEDEVSTLAMIALNRGDKPQLELAFVASGVYNTSHLVMSILEKFLLEIQENENVLNSLKSANK